MAVLPENMDKLNPEDSRQSFAILENYIPMSKIGDQKKLKGEAANGTQKQSEE